VRDFYGITATEHPDYVETEAGGIARWAELPEPERKAFHAGIEGLWRLYDDLGAETFGRVLRFTAAAEAGGFLRAELIPDLDAEPEFAYG
jgi:hypothetical protein